MLDNYLAIASLALFAFIGVALVVDPKATASLIAEARPSVKEALEHNESEVLAVTRLIDWLWIAMSVLIFVAFVLMQVR